MFSVRIVTTDHYLAAPIGGLDVQYAEQRGSEVKKVPIVRIFGATPAGQKTCMHVHGVFPYIYVPYDGTTPWDRYLRQFATSLDKAINVAQGHGQSNVEHVYKIVPVSGRSMYGYQDQEQQFLKIYLYNPAMVKKAADLLLGGAVLNKPFQPHEAHIPYNLQLFIDYNLYGMNMINVAAVKFRRKQDPDDEMYIPSQELDEGGPPRTPVSFSGLLNRSGSMTPSQRTWQHENIPSELYLGHKVERMSTCELEVDVVAADILNRLEVVDNIGTNPGLSALWEDERQRRRERGESTDIAPPDSQERGDVLISDSDLELRERLQQIVLELQPYIDSQSDNGSERSQDEFQLSQASEIDLHVSQDMESSQDTVMLEDDREVQPIVNIDSIHKVISASQSFCDVRPNLNKVTSEDQPLVDILAALAEDNEIANTPEVAVELEKLEEQDSVLSQVSLTHSQEQKQIDQEEMLEMSQRIWVGQEDEPGPHEYDLAGLDESWSGSQLEDQPGPSKVTAGSPRKAVANDDVDSDSDMSDIIPQYDGANDEDGGPKISATKRLGMRGPGFNMPPIHNPQVPMDNQNNMAAVNPFSDNIGPQSSFPHQNMGRCWQQGGQQQWMGAQQSPRQQIPGFPQRPPGMYGFHGNQGRMGPRYPQSPSGGGQTIFNPHQTPSPRSPGRVQISPMQGQISPIQSQMSPGSYQGPMASASHGSPYSISQSPDFVPNPLSNEPLQSSQLGMGTIATSNTDPFQRSQLNQKIQHLINTKRAEGLNTKRGIPPGMAGNRQSFDPSMPLGGISGMEGGDPFTQGLNRAGNTPFSPTSSSPMSTCAQRPSAIPQPGGHNPHSHQSRGYLMKHLEALKNRRNQAMPNSPSSNPMFNQMSSHQQRAQFNRHNSVPVQSRDFSPSANYDMVDGGGMTSRRLSASALGNIPIPRPNIPLSHSMNPAMSMPTQSSIVGSHGQSDSMPNSLAQHYSQQGLHVNVGTSLSMPSSMSVEEPRMSNQGKTSQIGFSAQYEQISPPITPMVSPNSVKRSSLSTPSPSNNPTHLSPLQKLLLDPMPPSAPESDTKSRNNEARSQSSSTTFDQQNNPNLPSPLSQDTFSPPAAQRKGIENSKLYNLLSGEKQKKESKPDALKPVNSSPSLQDSQQDLFAELESASQVGGPVNTVNTPSDIDDSLMSLFSDDFKVRPFTDESSMTQIASQPNNIQPFNPSIGHQESVPKDGGTLSGLQDFVSSVRKGSEYGVDFNKRKDNASGDRPTFMSQMSNSSVGSLDSSMSSGVPGTPQQNFPQHQPLPSPQMPFSQNDVNSPGNSQQFSSSTVQRSPSSQRSLGMSPGFQAPQSPLQAQLARNQQQKQTQPNQPLQQQQQHFPAQQQQTFNSGQQQGFNDWIQPSPSNPTPTPTGRKSKGEPGKRGRPRINKSLSVPTNEFGEPIKKKRGRPKKGSEQNNSNPAQVGNYQGMPMASPQNQQDCGMIGNRRMSMPEPKSTTGAHFMGSQKSFSELLEGEPIDLLAELNKDLEDGSFGSMFGNTNQGMNPQSSSAGFSNLNMPQSSQSFSSSPCNQPMSTYNSVGTSNPPFTTPTQSMPYQQEPLQSSQQHFFQQQQYQQQFQQPQVPHQQQQQPPSQQQHHQQYMASQTFSPLPNNFLAQQSEDSIGVGNEPNNELNLSQAMTISEPTVNFDTSLDSLFQKEDSPDVPEFPANTNIQTYNVHEHITNPPMKLARSLSSGVIDRRRHSSSSKKSKLEAMSNLSASSSDINAVMELIKYRQKSAPPQPCPSYSFKFQIPTPSFKRLKFIMKTSNVERNPREVVRMHPKDARKYSLLKIGREVVKLVCLTQERIDEIKERIAGGEQVAAMPAPVREIEIANVQATHSIIADLLAADSPVREDTDKSNDSQQPVAQSIQTPDNTVPEPSEGGETQNVQRPKKNLNRERRYGAMFKGNISRIPHLKKQRQGFTYFGKGHVGRGGHIRVRQNHPGLPKEFEDDENIVLKDVNLNEASDGVLTPIKSRTPVAGRSPAYYGGNISEAEAEKELLQSKLDVLKYDFDLNQSGNSNTFQDALFNEKDMEESGSENEEHDKENEEVVKQSDNTVVEVQELNCANEKECTSAKELEDVNVKDNIHNSGKEIKEIVVKDIDDTNVIKAASEEKMCTEDSRESTSKLENEIEVKMEPQETDCDMNVCDNVGNGDDKNAEGEMDKLEEMKIDNKIKKLKCMNKETVIKSEVPDVIDVKTNGLKNGLTMELKFENAQMILPKRMSNEKRCRSRSSSVESRSQSNSSQACSRTNSLIGSGDDMSIDSSNLISVVKGRHSSGNSEAGKRRKKLSSVNSSPSLSSRKGSRSSSCDSERKKKSKSRKKHRPYRYDSDSDGIPGVDYIVTNRFKGHKELRVVVDKLDEDSLGRYSEIARKMNDFNSGGYENQVSSTESEVRNTCESEGEVKNKPDSHRPFSGFSAEFERFLAQSNSAPIMSDCESDDCDEAEIPDESEHKEIPNDTGKNDSVPENNGEMATENNKSEVPAENEHNIPSENEHNSESEATDQGDLNDIKTEIEKVEELNDVEMKEESDSVEKSESDEKDVENSIEMVKDIEIENEELEKVKELQKEKMQNENVLNFAINNAVPEVTRDKDEDITKIEKLEGVQCKTGVKDLSSSSEDDEDSEHRKQAKPSETRKVTKSKPEAKKRKMPNKLHDGRAFCTKKSRRKRQRVKPTKLMSTLSVLHDATMEQLTIAQVNSDMDSSSNQSPFKSQPNSDVDSPFKIRTKTPDFELYADKSDDYKIEYEDTMYKLSYLSPIPSDSGPVFPPQPLSPEEMIKLDGTTELVKEAAAKLSREVKIIIPDVFKSYENTRDSDIVSSERSTDALNTPIKVAVAKTTTLTLQDIKSLCQAELENEAEKTQSPVLDFTNTDSYTSVDQPMSDTSSPIIEKDTSSSVKKNLTFDFSSSLNFFPTVDPSANSRDASPSVSAVSLKNFFPEVTQAISEENPLASAISTHQASHSVPPPLTVSIHSPESSSDISKSYATLDLSHISNPASEPLNLSTSSANTAVPSLEPCTYHSEDLRHGECSSPPPDLGPPVCQSVLQEHPERYSPPPQLTPNRRISSNSDASLDEDSISLTRACSSIRHSTENRTPPVLVPCKSPIASSFASMSSESSRCARVSDMIDSREFMTTMNSPAISKTPRQRLGLSPGGSITIVHSEEFSDISDENEDCHGHDQRSRSKMYIQRQSTGSFNVMENFQSKDQAMLQQSKEIERQRKIREVQEFEERTARQIRNDNRTDNNIFDLFMPRKDSNFNFPSSQVEHTRALNKSPIQNHSKRPAVPYNFQFSLDKVKEKIDDVDKVAGKLNPFDLTTDRSKMAAKAQIGYGHMNTSPRPMAAFHDFQKGHRNGEYQRSLSQNDMKMDYLMNGSSNGLDLRNGLTHEQDQLNKSFPITRREVSNGKYTSRNFFDNLNMNNEIFNGNIHHSQNTGTSSDLFSSGYSFNSSGIPPYQRSFSESARLDYSINHRSKNSEKFVKSVRNYMSRDRHGGVVENGPEFVEFGAGGGRRRTKRNSQSKQASSGGSPRNNTRSNQNRGSQDSPEFHAHKPHGHIHGQSNEATYGCHVITPLSSPPTLESIKGTSLQHGLSTNGSMPAFYGNPKDVPDKAREGGGQVLKVPSMLVCELEEFQSLSSLTGLKNWRTILSASNSSANLSQTGSTDLLYKLEQEPALKYAITGDQSRIITPTLLPPPKKSIEEWAKGRSLYKKLKHVQSKEEKPNSENNDKDIEKRNDNDDSDKHQEAKDNPNDQTSKTDTAKKTKKGYRLNLFTGKRELTEIDSSDSQKSSQDSNQQKNSGEQMDIDTSDVIAADKNETDDINTAGNRSNRSKSPDDDDGDSSKLAEDILHSTPVRRQSTDLFEPACTPITQGTGISNSQEEARSQEGAESQEEGLDFVTPKRIRPLRRLSTNTDSALRKAILTTQVRQQFGTPALQRSDTSQIEGPSLKNSFGFKHSQQQVQDAKALHEFQYITLLSVEVHAVSRGDLRPDPEVDPVQAIFYSIFNDVPRDKGTRKVTGVMIVDPLSANQNTETKGDNASTTSSSSANTSSANTSKASARKKTGSQKRGGTPKASTSSGKGSQTAGMTLLQRSGVEGVKAMYVKDEIELFHKFIEFVHSWDPDMLVGYEIQQQSWGYLLHRAAILSINLTQSLSRLPSDKKSSHHSKTQDEYGTQMTSEIHVAGRIVLNIWRIIQHEVTLNVYSFENAVFHVLHRRIPLYPYRNLTAWFQHRTHLHRWKVIEHYISHVEANLELLDTLDIVGRTSEFARVFGIEFFSVLSRGSQYRVESMMLRIAKPMNFIPMSPSVHQRARMKAPECIALTLEPESKFYTDPVVVVDFQSLYPSIMIAYNYCFTTCLGRLNWFPNAHEGPIEFGCGSLDLPPSVMKKLLNKVTVSPNGIVFCKQSVKRGVLGLMVDEILKTRLMVKKAMGSYKGDKTLSRMLNARQLGLKLIANVTYGYTAANFSGRMPCIEVGDSIVRKARETLERSIRLVEQTPEWRAKVVYGDTDSMFILLKGRSKDEAFKIGYDIAKKVTEMFPKPIKLKFEKVYLPCVLQTKKRYVGFSYETPDQKEPIYDAKGIETVRRDTCSAVAKILERSLKILFTSRDVSQVKSYVQQQCQKVMEGNVSLQDFIFAKEYRGMKGYKPGACVPALEIARKNLRVDKCSEPRTGERVPYVIVYGSPGLPLIQLVRQPLEVLQDPSLRLNATYYITKQILPPLDRAFSLLGVDVFSWYQEMPHSAGRIASHIASSDTAKKGTISQYFATSNCPVCDSQTKQPVCASCMKNPQIVCVALNQRITQWERIYQHILEICGSCMGVGDEVTNKTCVSLDCPILYRRSRAQADINRVQKYRDIINKVFK